MVNVMKASQRRVEQNKERIIRAALELFRVHGIRKVAINDIAQKAGTSAATVYNHFGSKEALVHTAVKHFFTSAGADFRKIVGGGTFPSWKNWSKYFCISKRYSVSIRENYCRR